LGWVGGWVWGFPRPPEAPSSPEAPGQFSKNRRLGCDVLCILIDVPDRGIGFRFRFVRAMRSCVGARRSDSVAGVESYPECPRVRVRPSVPPPRCQNTTRRGIPWFPVPERYQAWYSVDSGARTLPGVVLRGFRCQKATRRGVPWIPVPEGYQAWYSVDSGTL